MVAPILERGATARRVYFPEGTWEHYFTGEKITAGEQGFYREIECPIGTPAAFKKVHSSK